MSNGMSSNPIRVCFVCLGNICRSPTAEGVMKHLAHEAGLAQQLLVSSAGTGGYHHGEQADPRTRAEALRRGVTLTSRARRFRAEDFNAFDYVVAMDRSNQHDLMQLAIGADQLRKLHLLRSFDPASHDDPDVPDPYFGEGNGFARVFDICHAGCSGLLAHLRKTHGL